METYEYNACPSSSSDTVFHVDLPTVNQPHGQTLNGQVCNAGSTSTTNGTDDVTRMKNSVIPVVVGEGRVHDVTTTSNNSLRSTRRQTSGGGGGEKETHGIEEQGQQLDTSDGAEVFTEEQFTPLLSSNQYQLRKMASQTLMDVALMMANISQLRTLVSLGESLVQYYQVMMGLVICSLSCQVMFAIFMFVMWVRESDQHQKKDFYDNLKELEQSKGITRTTSQALRLSMANRQKEFRRNLATSRFNYVTMILVFFITVTNMFITGFGIKTVEKST